jgi:hypothetical protein
MPDMQNLVKKRQNLNPRIISQQSAQPSLLRELMYRQQALKAIFNLRCDAASAPAYTIPPYPI